ncbi:TetR family transcriptional regulator [Nocardioides sp. CER19]|uniref:TetR family transcriptional regulator n=1 Tax=Nocardioides sp. CER19 TaxID=3038538 RepID=UPI002447A345|nr:TetR family transcriptional regulator [Nocardioides sp. CER19]MDH2415751.1 TetR family transcriptional regulator [Nocardioides sp. CER19]
MSDPDLTPTLRDHAREAVRAEVQRQAWLLFSEHGFEATTVDRIAGASGMSRRTFFRYFASKDDLVLSRMVESGAELLAVLDARPADERPWTALRAAFQVIVDKQLGQPDRSRRLQLMLRDEPAVRATVEEWRRRWTALLTPVVAARLAGGDDYVALRAEALTRSALECLESAQDHWAEHEDADLSRLVDEAMGAVAPLS